MPDPNTEHGLRVQLATALRECNSLHVRLRGETERADRSAKDVAETLDSLNAAQKERDSYRAALTDIVTLCMDVADTPDWRKAVGDKARAALFGPPAWERK
jgi:hypothetical protein